MAANRILDKGGVPIHVFTDDIDQGSIEQLAGLSRLDIVTGRVAVMPDVHVGIGATIGSVVPTRKTLIPAAVGVDIGCGMTAVKLSLTADRLPDDLKPVREATEKAVPVGRAGHQRQAAPESLIDELKPGLDFGSSRSTPGSRSAYAPYKSGSGSSWGPWAAGIISSRS